MALCLSAGPAVAADTKAAPREPEAVQQLDEVEVSAARIAPPKRTIPMPLPDVSAAIPLPPESVGVQPVVSAPTAPRSRALLRDETAATKGVRTRARYLESMRPPYPKRAREMGWEGTVVLRVEVRPDGTVGAASVHRTSGYLTLDEAALIAVKRWRFAPPTDGAFSFATVVDVPVRFDLKEQGDPHEEGRGS
ncbi:MAG: energy transducer TonB [Nitrospirota bacterium]